MDGFFARYPDFQYNPEQSPVAEFVRLRATRPDWNQVNPTTSSYRKARKRFLQQWDESTATTADRVWVYFCKFPELKYNYDTEESNILSEFRRLTTLMRWRTGRNHYRQQLARLQLALGQVPSQASLAVVRTSTQSPDEDRLDTSTSAGVAIDTPSAITPTNSGVSSPEPYIYTPPLSDLHPKTPLARFFNSHYGFLYNPSAPARDEFDRLAVHRGWKNGSKRFRKARSLFMAATSRELIWHLETDNPCFLPIASSEAGAGSEEEEPQPSEADEENIKPWRRMCQLLDLKTPEGVTPKSKTQCKKVLEHVFINIFDFLDYLRIRLGTSPELAQTLTVRRFPTLSALAKYSYDEGKVFSRGAAKVPGNELLRFLLRKIASGLRAEH